MPPAWDQHAHRGGGTTSSRDAEGTCTDVKRTQRVGKSKVAARKKPSGKTVEERDRISLGRIESFIDQTLQGQMQCPSCREKYEVKDISPSAVALLRARYDKLRPSLASTEVTMNDPRDNARPEDVAARLAALFNEKPDLFAQVMALKDDGKPLPVVADQTQSSRTLQ